MTKQIKSLQRESDTVQGSPIVIVKFTDANGQPLDDATLVVLAEEGDTRLSTHLHRLSFAYQVSWEDVFAESRGGLS